MLQKSAMESLRAAVPLPVKHSILRVLNVRRDLTKAARSHAFQSSAAFVSDSMPLAKPFKTPAAVLQYSLDLAPETGLVAEFGVYSGATLRAISARRPGAHGFDSFEGLPEDWRYSHPQSKFAVQNLPPVGDAELHVGWFSDTVPKFAANNTERAAFLHLDADLYSSTVTVFTELGDRIESGTVLLFDEYFNYPGWQHHEHKAFLEFIERTGLKYEYIAYNARGEQVAVKIL